MDEQRTATMHEWAEQLREALRLKLEPGSDNLRAEYKLANDLVYAFRGREPEKTEQETYDAWCPPGYRQMIWTPQAQEAARSAFAAAWYLRGGGRLATVAANDNKAGRAAA